MMAPNLGMGSSHFGLSVLSLFVNRLLLPKFAIEGGNMFFAFLPVNVFIALFRHNICMSQVYCLPNRQKVVVTFDERQFCRFRHLR